MKGIVATPTVCWCGLGLSLVLLLLAMASSASGEDLANLQELQDLLVSGDRGSFRSVDVVPKRPEQFRNARQLNEYLEELKQYYTIIGRPSVAKVDSLALRGMIEVRFFYRLDEEDDEEE